jgi:hypothetical protein
MAITEDYEKTAGSCSLDPAAFLVLFSLELGNA